MESAPRVWLYEAASSRHSGYISCPPFSAPRKRPTNAQAITKTQKMMHVKHMTASTQKARLTLR